MRRVYAATLSVMAATVIAASGTALGAEEKEGARLDWMVKAWGDGRHNAFTDLVSWNGSYYLCFRHGASHGSVDGEIRVMRSADLKVWEHCGTLNTLGDDRDPHFAVKGDTLFVYFGIWDLIHQEGAATVDRGCVRSAFAATQDGETWSKPQSVYEPGFWLWRVEVFDGVFYSAAYTARRPRTVPRELRLLRSEDGLNWELASTIATENVSGETAMWTQPDGSLWALTRSNETSIGAIWSKSNPERTQWTNTATGVTIHSPAIARWNGRLFVAGRGFNEKDAVTRIWEIVDDTIIERFTLPSGGDTSYPGLLVDPDSLGSSEPGLFISWYSQHERDSEPGGPRDAASVYVGRVTVHE